jgi:hypothetical protein
MDVTIPNTLPPVPDAPGLPEWVKHYAEYEGQSVALAERPDDWPYDGNRRFSVFNLKELTYDATGRPNVWAFISTDDYAEALAEFRKQAELLLAEEE